ncbi:hypothetical protein C3F09_09100 [candidate division GN15 bacterium]|uniref:Fibronectin type-III domain-containing protein n=1 Tax=candidate division GN15 bacterium TaxID=2072418 RepID=A0A855X100_9BACT|nr:MAG: hypothetical protein C3F09_09100 [candidate division GN15 bacterium]
MRRKNILTVAENSLPKAIRCLLLTAGVLLMLHVASVGQQAQEFGVVPLSAPDGMLLVIGGPLLNPSTAAAHDGWIGYHIYRRSPGDTGFVRITSAPLSRPGSLAELEDRMGGPIDGFERFAGLPSKEALWQGIERNDSSIIPISFLSKNFRHALGMLITDTKVERGKTYEYRAAMVALNGTQSQPSESQQATFGTPLIPLIGPLDTKAESTDRGVVLSWQANPGDSGAFSYSVYRCPDSIGTFLKLNLAALTLVVDSGVATDRGSFTDTTARAGRTYYYAIVSTDYAGNESVRKPLIPVTPRDISTPAIPQNVFANPSSLGITVTWDTVTGENIAGYNVYRSGDADSNYVRINAVLLPPDTGFYEDRGTTLVDRFFYRVTAVNRAGRESEKSARALSLFQNRHEPLPPQEIRAESRPNGIRVTWKAGDESDIRGYYVYRADSYNGSLSQISPLIGKDTTEYLDTSNYLSAAGQYWYLVQSINFTGIMSAYSVPVVAYPNQSLTADAPRSFFGYADGRRVLLFWTAVDDIALAGYHLYRAIETDSLRWERVTAAPLIRTTTEYIDTGTTAGATYLYQLRAVNDKGTESQPSNTMRITVFEPAPLPPGGIRVVQEGKALKVIWIRTQQPSAAGYRVYRRTDTESRTVITPQALPATTTEYRDTSVRSGVRYYYSVCCVDQTGREGDPGVEVSYFSE